MQRLFNIVGTRVPRGDVEHARRWYVDHVHLLFGHEGLMGARLWQRVPGAAEVGAAPDMICCYDFGDHLDSFLAYDSSPLRAEVERDRQSGWGRDGIEVCLRARFRRRYERCAPDAAREGRSRIASAPADVAPDWDRTLAASAHERGVRRLEIYRAESDPRDDRAPGPLGGLWVANADTAVRPPEAPAPGPVWQAVYLPLEQWTR